MGPQMTADQLNVHPELTEDNGLGQTPAVLASPLHICAKDSDAPTH